MQDNNNRKVLNKPSLALLKSDLHRAVSAHTTNKENINRWLDVLHVTNGEKLNLPDGKSHLQPKECRKLAEWRYSEFSEPMLSTPDMIRVKPRTHVDREAARQNQILVNYQFSELMDKEYLVDRYTRNFVDEGTVIAKVCWKRETEMSKRMKINWLYKYPETDMEYKLVQDAINSYQADPNIASRMPIELLESVLKTLETGEVTWAVIESEEEEEYEKVLVNQPDIEICDYRNVIPDPTCNGILSDAQFIVYSYSTSLSSLRKAPWYQKLDEVNTENTSDNDIEGYTRLDDSSFQFEDEPRKKVTVHEYWGYYDLYNTGKVVPFVAAWVDDVMIRCEASPYPFYELPFIMAQYLPVKDSLYGEPDAALTADNQRVYGAITRAMIDTFSSTAAGQTGIPDGMLSYVQEKNFLAGKRFKFNRNFTPDQIWQASMPELPASAYNMLNLQSQEASSMTGIQPFSQGMTGDAYGSTAAGVNVASSAQAKRTLSILRRFVKGWKDITKMILAMNAVWLEDEEIVRVTDEDFVKIQREDLVGMKLLSVELSISTQELDDIKANKMTMLLQTTGNTMPFEMTKLIYEDITNLYRMPELAEKIRNYTPEPSPEQQLEMKKLELELMTKQLELENIRADTNKKQADSDVSRSKAELNASQTDLNTLEYIHKEQGVDFERDKALQQAQAEGNVKRDLIKLAAESENNLNTTSKE